jgi:hypothetical protein
VRNLSLRLVMNPATESVDSVSVELDERLESLCCWDVSSNDMGEIDRDPPENPNERGLLKSIGNGDER